MLPLPVDCVCMGQVQGRSFHLLTPPPTSIRDIGKLTKNKIESFPSLTSVSSFLSTSFTLSRSHQHCCLPSLFSPAPPLLSLYVRLPCSHFLVPTPPLSFSHTHTNDHAHTLSHPPPFSLTVTTQRALVPLILFPCLSV